MPAILERCVSKLMKSKSHKPGKPADERKSSAFAICTASLKKSGKLSEDEIDKILNELESKEFADGEEIENWLGEKIELAAKEKDETMNKKDIKKDKGLEDNKDKEVKAKKFSVVSKITLEDVKELGEGKGTIRVAMIRCGSWEHPWYGLFRVTPATLEQFIKNFDAGVPQDEVAFDFRHNPELGAAAWIKSLEEENSHLFGNVELTVPGLQAIKEKRFKYFSTEFTENYKDPEDGKAYGACILGGGLTNRPFIKGLPPIALSEDGDEEILKEVDGPMNRIAELEAKVKALDEKIKELTTQKDAEGDAARLAEVEKELGATKKSLEDTKKELDAEKKKNDAPSDKNDKELQEKVKKLEDDLKKEKEDRKVLETALEGVRTSNKSINKKLYAKKIDEFVLGCVQSGIPPAVMTVAKKFLSAEFETPVIFKLTETKEGKDETTEVKFFDAVDQILTALPKECRIDLEEKTRSPRDQSIATDTDEKYLEEAEKLVADKKITLGDAIIEVYKKHNVK